MEMKWEDLEEGDEIKFTDEFWNYATIYNQGWVWFKDDGWEDVKFLLIKRIRYLDSHPDLCILYFSNHPYRFCINRKTGKIDSDFSPIVFEITKLKD